MSDETAEVEDTRTPAQKAADTRAANKAAADAQVEADAQNAVVTSEPGDEVGEGEPATAEAAGAPESGPMVGVAEEKPSDGKVDVMLSNPITQDRHKIELGIDPSEKCNVHDTVRVTRNNAKRLIDAGYAQADPENADHVRAVLFDGNPNPSTNPPSAPADA